MNSVRPPISCELSKGIKVLIASQNYALRFSFSPKDCKFAMQNWVILSSGSDVPTYLLQLFQILKLPSFIALEKKSPLPLPPHPIYVAALMMLGW